MLDEINDMCGHEFGLTSTLDICENFRARKFGTLVWCNTLTLVGGSIDKL